MAKLNFNNMTARRQPIRAASSKFLKSKLRGHVEVNVGERLADAFLPYKALPVMFIDVELEDGVVIPKGTIVSLLTNQSNSTTNPHGMVDIGSTGHIPVFLDKTNSDAVVDGSIDDSFWGYDDNIAALMVPANGGIQSNVPYSADDVTCGTFTSSGTLVTAARVAAADTCPVQANMPVGITYTDVYQDIRGKNLNYQMWGHWGVLCDYYIEVPFCDINAQTNFASGLLTDIDEQISNLNATTCAGYIDVWKRYAFMYFSSANNGGEAGQLVKSDLHGKFIPQGTNLVSAATAQTVGKLILTDSRYPKDMLELVDTYPGSGLPGTETGGTLWLPAGSLWHPPAPVPS